MNKYEKSTQETTDLCLVIKEKPLRASDGFIKRNRVTIRNTIATSTQKACVFAEELEHYHTSYGNIIDMKQAINRKQEVADYFEVTEDYLEEAINCYREKYGEGKGIDNYYVMFEPSLKILKMI